MERTHLQSVLALAFFGGFWSSELEKTLFPDPPDHP